MAEGERLAIAGYEGFEPIGSGGFATVYRARHQRLDRVVAVKVIDRVVGDDDKAAFEAEARAVAQLEGRRNVVQVYDAGETEDGKPYLALAYMPGGSIQDRITAHGPMPVADVLAYGAQMADALAAVHELGLVHRDVKPHNVLLGRDGEANLADFGIASLIDGVTTGEAGGNVAGTLAYLAPELMVGSARPSIVTDVYSLGLTLAAMLLGHTPFTGDQRIAIPALLAAKVTGPPPPVRRADVPDALASLVERCVDGDASARPASAVEVRDALRAIARTATANAPGPPPAPGPDPVPGDDPPRGRDLRVVLLCVAAAILVISAAVSVAILLQGSDGDGAEPDDQAAEGLTVTLEEAGDEGPDYFTPDATVGVPEMAGGSAAGVGGGGTSAGGAGTSGSLAVQTVGQATGDEPGLYGGSRDAALCDRTAIADFLEENQPQAEAWAGVVDIDVDEIRTYLDGLTPVVLTRDTLVLNHGFSDGGATPRLSILEAGTAVLVDATGVPRVRCECGNPLDLGPRDGAALDTTGSPWPDFDEDDVTVVDAAPTVQASLDLDDVTTQEDDDVFTRPIGTDGDQDRPAVGLSAECTNDTYGFVIRYPAEYLEGTADGRAEEGVTPSPCDRIDSEQERVDEYLDGNVLDVILGVGLAFNPRNGDALTSVDQVIDQQGDLGADGGTVLRREPRAIGDRPGLLVVAEAVPDAYAGVDLGDEPTPDPEAAAQHRRVTLYLEDGGRLWYVESGPRFDADSFEFQEALVLAVAGSFTLVGEAEPPEDPDGAVLRADGLGGADLGSDPAPAIAALTELLGEPTDQFGPDVGNLCSEPSRSVVWGDFAVRVEISSPAGGPETLIYWSAGEGAEALTTAEGIHVGSTVAELRAAYPDIEIQPGSVELDTEAFGTVSDPPWFFDLAGEGDDDTVTSIEAGQPCSGE